MKKFNLGIFAILSILNFNGCADNQSSKPPIKTQVEQKYNQYYNFYYPEIIITSVVDNLTINDVIVNKGNCKYSKETLALHNGRGVAVPLLPSELTFGKQLEISLDKSCKVLKIDLNFRT
ncbi:MAG: hypothetical protein A2019_04275 [Sulfurimonas sp. GWF2_37_8]|nr:MAG: hypothetical protein A2019_04275 [Sulfurimonas sp. GWF2_37_8]